MSDSERTPAARALAERCLVNLLRRCEPIDVPVVLLGGLVPPLLCTTSVVDHESTHYDIAYLLVHNGAGGPDAKAAAILDEF